MYVRRLEDLKYIDAFQPPTIFEDTIDLYKEWHHFVFFDGQHELFGLLNFSVTGNPYYPNKGFATAIILFADRRLRWRGNIESFSVESLRLFSLHPGIIFQNISVVYTDRSYRVLGKLLSQPTLVDLEFRVDSLPISADAMTLEGLAPVWKGWVGITRLAVKGTVFVEGERFNVSGGVGYHDHNRGRFKWGDPFGWDGGFILEDVVSGKSAPIAISFLVERSVDMRRQRRGAVFLWTREGLKKVFLSDQVQIGESGEFAGPYHKLPGTARILWPERPRGISSRITIDAKDERDRVEIDFEPVTLCQIVSSNHLGKGETIWNEMYGTANIKGLIDGKMISKETRGYLETVRPAR